MNTILLKKDHSVPAFVTKGATLSLRPGVSFREMKAAKAVSLPKKLSAGSDYVITLYGSTLKASKLDCRPDAKALGGFHVGLDGKIAVHSIWDAYYRPTCHDPRGMVRVPGVGWVDIYLTNIDPHDHGTSAAGKEIADGFSHIMMPNGERKPLTWWNAIIVLGRHGKQPLSRAEFAIAMQGVEEGKNYGYDPKTTAHAAGLKSSWGIEQATGCMWTWSRDIYDHDCPWMYVLGGSWVSDRSGARRCLLSDPGDYWFSIGARGRCDHLEPEGSEAKA